MVELLERGFDRRTTGLQRLPCGDTVVLDAEATDQPRKRKTLPDRVAKMTLIVRKMRSGRSGTAAGSASAAASETAPRRPLQAITVR